MVTIGRWIWGIGILALLISCSTPQSSQVLVPHTEQFEQTYQDGRAAFKAQRYSEAAALFARVVAADPEHLKARLNWAAALSYNNQPSEAIIQCQNVLARDPANAEAYYQWGAVLVRIGKHQEAVEKLEQALVLKPMTELLQEDPLLQQSLQAYLSRQRRQRSDPGVEVQKSQQDSK